MSKAVIDNFNDVEQAANVALGATLRRMVKSGLITNEQATAFVDSHIAVIVKRRPLLTRIAELFFGNDTNELAYNIRVVEIDPPEQESSEVVS